MACHASTTSLLYSEQESEANASNGGEGGILWYFLFSLLNSLSRKSLQALKITAKYRGKGKGKTFLQTGRRVFLSDQANSHRISLATLTTKAPTP